MIEESQRIEKHLLEESVGHEQGLYVQEAEGSSEIQESQAAVTSEMASNRLFLELLVCSLLLWGLLFMKETTYGNQLMPIVKTLLNQEISIQSLQDFVEHFEGAVKQIL